MNYDAIIIEAGTHDGLPALNELYSTHYNTCFRYQSLEYVEQARKLVGYD
ncbi:MAG TPA: hypothetical protein VJ972_02120 [Anaerolineales bacterium]|nr:hypothetical protein [Anaerolineales bacterium]